MGFWTFRSISQWPRTFLFLLPAIFSYLNILTTLVWIIHSVMNLIISLCRIWMFAPCMVDFRRNSCVLCHPYEKTSATAANGPTRCRASDCIVCTNRIWKRRFGTALSVEIALREETRDVEHQTALSVGNVCERGKTNRRDTSRSLDWLSLSCFCHKGGKISCFCHKGGKIHHSRRLRQVVR